jgi:hypothetical protein
MEKLQTDSSLSNMKRIELILTGLEVGYDNLIFPAGFNVWREHLQEVTVFESHHASNISTHNTIIDLQLNFGIAGVLLLFLILLYLFKRIQTTDEFLLFFSVSVLIFLYPFEGVSKIGVLVLISLLLVVLDEKKSITHNI